MTKTQNLNNRTTGRQTPEKRPQGSKKQPPVKGFPLGLPTSASKNKQTSCPQNTFHAKPNPLSSNFPPPSTNLPQVKTFSAFQKTHHIWLRSMRLFHLIRTAGEKIPDMPPGKHHTEEATCLRRAGTECVDWSYVASHASVCAIAAQAQFLACCMNTAAELAFFGATSQSTTVNDCELNLTITRPEAKIEIWQDKGVALWPHPSHMTPRHITVLPSHPDWWGNKTARKPARKHHKEELTCLRGAGTECVDWSYVASNAYFKLFNAAKARNPWLAARRQSTWWWHMSFWEPFWVPLLRANCWTKSDITIGRTGEECSCRNTPEKAT